MQDKQQTIILGMKSARCIGLQRFFILLKKFVEKNKNFT